MPISRLPPRASVQQTSTPTPSALKLPKAWSPGAPHRPPAAIWTRLREDLFQHSGSGTTAPKHQATMADVDRVIARAEKNGVSPGELLALTSIKSTQHPYFAGGSESAAWKKLNGWTLAQRSGPVLQARVDGEVARQATKGKGTVDGAGAQKLMAWVRDENSVAGAVALKAALVKAPGRFSADATRVLNAFLALTP
jgi:hypothetical protein